MIESNINYEVDPYALTYGKMDREIVGRMVAKNNEKKKEELRSKGIIGSKEFSSFMIKHKGFFASSGVVQRDGSNFFGGILPLSSLATTTAYKNTLKTRMYYECDLSKDQIESLDEANFFVDLGELTKSSEIEKSVERATKQKTKIERAWKEKESDVLSHITGILGYKPKTVGKVNVYIMDPKYNTFRSYQVNNNKTLLYYSNSNEKEDINKVISHMAHQAVHQPMLPYKPSMTSEEKAKYHAFIKFLTDKETYKYLTGRSSLAITTQNENAEVMGKIYPFWLGYRYRNANKEGLDPVTEIRKCIEQDQRFFEKIKDGTKAKKLYSTYDFEKLDPIKISTLFRERRAITPYEFAKLDFDNKSLVYQDKYLKKVKKASSPVDEER